MQDFEKLGVFYLGRQYDPDQSKPLEQLLLYDSKDLTTHAVCVGMTGSGKTGLCLDLLEEAAIDQIPALVIDPKGDLSNLLLTFPDLAPQDFLPWVHKEDAQRQNLSAEQFAAAQAELWKKGLAADGQDGARIKRLRDAADFAIYTPGSSAGLSVSILRAFAAPPQAVRDDSELLAERINASVSGLLALLGIEANPLESREHILLSTIFGAAWRAGQDLDLAAVIQQTQTPPFAKVGVVDLESFFPAKARFALAKKINNLLSAPGFAAWTEGEPLNVDALLHSQSGKPRIAIFSIAHLDDAQRMFFVTMLLNETLSWMRAQSGTTSLRAILYMDEIFGYLPPSANPPSKTPLLTLLKQARAFGLGIVLATQNPVDLDYKALSNAGTWFIGRLQTERDKARVLAGLQGAAANAGANFDTSRIEHILAGLKNRVFLMNNVHEDAPVVFQARWAMSYLCGPLSRDQIKTLMHDQKGAIAAATTQSAQSAVAAARAAPVSAAAAKSVGNLTAQPPLVPPQVAQYFLPLRGDDRKDAQLTYRPMAFGIATIHFADKKLAVDAQTAQAWLADFHDVTGEADWDAALLASVDQNDLEKTPAQSATYGAWPDQAVTAKSESTWRKSFGEALFRRAKIDLLKSPSLEQVSKPDESERDFRLRLQDAGRQERDDQIAKLRTKFGTRQAQLQERIRRAQQTVEKEKTQAREQKWQTIVSFGTTILEAFLGRKRISTTTVRKAQTAARGVGRSMKQSAEAAQAEENVESLQAQLAQIEEELRSEMAALQAKIDPLTETLETVTLRPKKSDVVVTLAALAWVPQWQDASGAVQPAWK